MAVHGPTHIRPVERGSRDSKRHTPQVHDILTILACGDGKGGDLETIYSKDDLLTTIMIYLVTRSFNTASWVYYAQREETAELRGKGPFSIQTPTAAALFPHEFLPWPPRSYVARSCNLVRWTEMPSGGHFAAMEEPELLVNDIRSFARTLR